MLANGITLSYKETTSSSWNVLSDLKEVPGLNMNKEWVENTALDAKNKQYEPGVGDYGDLTYKFKFKNGATNDSYRIMRKAMEDDKLLSFKHEFPDGTAYIFDAYVSIEVTGGTLNGVIDVNVSLRTASDMKVTDPGTSNTSAASK